MVGLPHEDKYICKVAKTEKEAIALIESGFDHVTDIGTHKLFRKRKTSYLESGSFRGGPWSSLDPHSSCDNSHKSTFLEYLSYLSVRQIEFLMYLWFLNFSILIDVLHSSGSLVLVMLISPSKRERTAFDSSGGCISGYITASIIKPLVP